MSLFVDQIATMTDNYIYLIHDNDSKQTAVVDPASSLPVLNHLKSKGWKLTHILNTHHHFDHVGGNLDLASSTGSKVYGSKVDRERIPGITVELSENDVFMIGNHTVRVLETFGHTIGHIIFWIEGAEMLFVGDTLFSMGCGRLAEGSAPQMYASLQKISQMPEKTKIFCAHEYTLANGEFAKSIEPDNQDLHQRCVEVHNLRALNQSTVPTTVELELRTNPFLRVTIKDSCDIISRIIGMPKAKPEEVFKEIRHRKDMF